MHVFINANVGTIDPSMTYGKEKEEQGHTVQQLLGVVLNENNMASCCNDVEMQWKQCISCLWRNTVFRVYSPCQ